MGMIKWISDAEKCPQSPNPQPNKFTILKKKNVGKYQIVEIKYEGCTTFGGRKLLLMKKEKIGSYLDPHLLGNNHPVIARFEPNENGWKMAMLAAGD